LEYLVAREEAPAELFARTRAWVGGAPASEPAEAAPEAGASVGPWVPPQALLEPLADPGEGLHALRVARAGPLVTSYTRLKSGQGGGYVAPEAEGESFTGETHDLTPPEADPSGLPGGSGVGVFLHEVLEALDFEAVREADDVDGWAAREEVRAAFRASARRNGVNVAHVPEAQRLVFGALRVPVDVGPLVLPSGLCGLGHRVAEMSFHYPLPEQGHPLLCEPRPSPDRWPFEVRRGYVRGVVDLVFEHEGRLYFLDWKSDRLPSWSAAMVAQHVERNYTLQARLYALGVLRLLDARTAEDYEARFGGLLYCFLRGMDGSSAAVHFERPSWDDVLGWESALRAEHAFGYRFGRGEAT
ncbi:MAG: PD-(D/E)XK nuclease family protein, partial [Myxococcota bacterium]